MKLKAKEMMLSKMNEKVTYEDMWGMSTAIDLHRCNEKTIKDEVKIKEFVRKLVKLIDMKAFGETVVVNFGEDERVSGFSMMQLIETSLISGHFANQSRNVYLDVFSCKKYEPRKAAEFAKKFFEAEDYNMKTILRK